MSNSAPDPHSDLRSCLIRNLIDIDEDHQTSPPLNDTSCAPLTDGMAAAPLCIGIDLVALGKVSCPHQFDRLQEEAVIVPDGPGTLYVASERVPISAGGTISIPAGPDHPHQNTYTSDAPLKYLSISARDALDVVGHPDSANVPVRSMHAPAERSNAYSRLLQTGPEFDSMDGEL